jgi:ABC-type transport system involved in multi-copper enzyme maturation permease subunit
VTGLFLSEVRKIATTSTVYWLLAGGVAFSLLAVSSLSGADEAQMARPIVEQLFLFLGTFVKLAFLILGIRVATDEFRYGTANPTFLFTPTRWKVLVAKTGAAASFGLVMAAIVQTVLFTGGAAFFAFKDQTLQIGSEGVYAFVGAVLAGTIWTVVGLGIGALIRNQVIAIVAVVVWFMGLEDVIGSRMGDTDRFLPGRAGLNLALAPDDRTLIMGLTTVCIYAAVALALGTLAVQRRDVA